MLKLWSVNAAFVRCMMSMGLSWQLSGNHYGGAYLCFCDDSDDVFVFSWDWQCSHGNLFIASVITPYAVKLSWNIACTADLFNFDALSVSAGGSAGYALFEAKSSFAPSRTFIFHPQPIRCGYAICRFVCWLDFEANESSHLVYHYPQFVTCLNGQTHMVRVTTWSVCDSRHSSSQVVVFMESMEIMRSLIAVAFYVLATLCFMLDVFIMIICFRRVLIAVVCWLAHNAVRVCSTDSRHVNTKRYTAISLRF